MNVLANPKGSVGRWNLKFWRLERFYTHYGSKGVVETPISSHRLIQNKTKEQL
jgi:hypothetical protein